MKSNTDSELAKMRELDCWPDVLSHLSWNKVWPLLPDKDEYERLRNERWLKAACNIAKTEPGMKIQEATPDFTETIISTSKARYYQQPNGEWHWVFCGFEGSEDSLEEARSAVRLHPWRSEKGVTKVE